MYILFNGALLNTENIISFRKGTVDRNGKYPIYADHMVTHNASSDATYFELLDNQTLQQARFDELTHILIAQSISFQVEPKWESSGPTL